MTRLSRPLDLAQPFVIEVHPLHCDCPSCEDLTDEPSLLGSIIDCSMLGLGAILSGQLIGFVLQVSGVLALIGIG